MTPEQKRIAIAEACGWATRPSQSEFGSMVWVHPDGETCGLVKHMCIPDYLNDLNSMHEAEKVLRNQFTTLEETYWRNLSHVQPHPIYATAFQRADAFLKTIGKL